MSLIFVDTLSEINWLLAHNNNIISFSDSTSRVPLYCDIEITGLETVRIYPDTNENFWFNFKTYISSLLEGYDDNLDINQITADPSVIQNYIYDYSERVYDDTITVTVTFDNDETEVETYNAFFLLGVEQEYDFRKGRTVKGRDEILMHPFTLNSNQRYYMRYWDGYPFDISYTRGIQSNTTSQTITNNTNGITSPLITLSNDAHRIVFSTGDDTITLEDFLPITTGYNELEFPTGLFIDLWKTESTCGTYLKWLNEYGGWSYWLFNEQHERTLPSRSTGFLNDDFSNVGADNSQFKALGRDVEDKMRIVAENLSHEDINVLKGIVKSPKVYLFTGLPFTIARSSDWLEVSIDNTRLTERDFKNNVPTIRMTLSLPNHYTITL